MFLTHTANLICDSLLALAYPQVCALCSKSVERRIYGPSCLDCWNACRIFNGEEAICWKCGAPAINPAPVRAPQVIRCRRCESHHFDSARACGVYEGALRETILQLKRQPHLPRFAADLLIATGRRSPLNYATRIIPVPLHPEREVQRGFNQAAIIARAISSSLELMEDERSLIRVAGSQKYRAGLDSKGRADTVSGAFTVQFPKLIAGEKILLVDDVFTTGATASNCAAALLSAGAESVYVLTIARPAG